jgi:hypothetical protein
MIIGQNYHARDDEPCVIGGIYVLTSRKLNHFAPFFMPATQCSASLDRNKQIVYC